MCCLLWLWLLSWAPLATAQNSRTAEEQRLLGERVWKGQAQVEQCAWCHYQNESSFGNRPTDFCKLTEARHWLSHDPHSISRLRIEPLAEGDASAQPSNVLSRRIIEKLKYQTDTVAGYQKFVENCLTCHAGFRLEGKQPLSNRREGPPGLSCVICHQAGDRQEWIDLHGSASAPKTWRLLSPETKESHGLRPLTTADAQARLCNQCHIGDLSQNKFISHAMYSAGHPPLPAVELQSLTKAMSPHWRSADELYKALSSQPTDRDAYFKINYARPFSIEGQRSLPDTWNWRAQAIALGALQSQMQLLTLMEQAASPDVSKRWADYALYDCAGCHHGLQSPSWRQKYRRETPPGRPLPVQWASVLEPLLAPEQPGELLQLRTDYLRAITMVPFGQREEVCSSARNYRQALEKTQSQLARAALEPRFARRAIERLSRTPPVALFDIDSARQLSESAINLSQELGLPVEQIPRVDGAPFDPAVFVNQLEKWKATLPP